MNFNTSSFALFMLVVGGLYFMAQGTGRWRLQNLILLVASYVFYASWDYRFLFLILVSTAIDYTCGLAIAHSYPNRRTSVALLFSLATAAWLLCAPIDWSAIVALLRPDAAYSGGWIAPHEFTGVFLAHGDWLPFWAAVATVVIIAALAALGERTTGDRRRRYYLVLSVATNLTLLGFFKYFDFFVDSAVALLASLGLNADPWQLGIVVPVGISFYTFQTLSYSIDIYRGNLRPTRSLPDFALFVAFFPQLVAGPIERAAVLLPQLEKPRRVTWAGIQSGCFLVGWGLYKKIFIADNLARFVAPVYALDASASGPQVLLATYAFAFQIYCDFSGYSDIARGISRCLGIELMVNFNVPYVATNPREFWRRWHISLSTWLRDYLYISLGGNRGGSFYIYRNLMMTMLLGGLWHGARANFVWWGLYQGLLLCAHRLLEPLILRLTPKQAYAKRLFGTLCWFAFFQCICYGWLLFRSETGLQVWKLTTSLATGWGQLGDHAGFAFRLVWFCWLLVLVQFSQVRSGNLLAPLSWAWPVRLVFYLVLFYMAVIFGSYDEVQFIYFQF